MTNVITVPPSLDDATFEQILEPLSRLQPDDRVLIDARHARWASPYGLTALLTLAQTRHERPSLAVPEADETASYWARAGFFRYAADLYELIGTVPRGRQNDPGVLLEVTPVNASELKFFSQSTSKVWVWLTGMTLIWAIAVAVYAFYSLFWGVKCPACGSGFGSREECRSCGLPKYRGAVPRDSKKLHFYD